MPVISDYKKVKEIYADAAEKGWVIPCICSENLTTTEAIFAAAEEFAVANGYDTVPVTIAMTVKYSHRPQAPYYTHNRRADIGLRCFAADAQILSEVYPHVSAMLHLDHVQPVDDADLLESDLSGFASIMYDASTFPFDKNIEMTAAFVQKMQGRILIEGACVEIYDAGGSTHNSITTPEDAERKGLGTTATRAGIIEKLISAGFAERKGKKLIPTKDGYNLVAILPDSLTSPQLTAEWETRLTGIAKGSDSPADFMRGIEEMTAGLVKTYSAISEDKAKLFTPQREAIGTCPRCGAAVYEGKKNFYCSDRACSFVMWKNDRFFEQRKKAFTKAIAAALLKDGKVKIKGMYSTKTGKTFDGVVLLADTGGKYVNFRVEQNRK